MLLGNGAGIAGKVFMVSKPAFGMDCELMMLLQCRCLGLGDCNSDFHVFHEIAWGEV